MTVLNLRQNGTSQNKIQTFATVYELTLTTQQQMVRKGIQYITSLLLVLKGDQKRIIFCS